MFLENIKSTLAVYGDNQPPVTAHVWNISIAQKQTHVTASAVFHMQKLKGFQVLCKGSCLVGVPARLILTAVNVTTVASAKR